MTRIEGTTVPSREQQHGRSMPLSRVPLLVGSLCHLVHGGFGRTTLFLWRAWLQPVVCAWDLGL